MNSISYIFKVKIAKGVSRTIQISSSNTYDDLHNAIIESIDFDADHLYVFHEKYERWTEGTIVSPYAIEYDDHISACDAKLIDYMAEVGYQFKYLFDFGDSWHFDIELKKIIPCITPKAFVFEEKGTSPKQYDFK